MRPRRRLDAGSGMARIVTPYVAGMTTASSCRVVDTQRGRAESAGDARSESCSCACGYRVPARCVRANILPPSAPRPSTAVAALSRRHQRRELARKRAQMEAQRCVLSTSRASATSIEAPMAPPSRKAREQAQSSDRGNCAQEPSHREHAEVSALTIAGGSLLDDREARGRGTSSRESEASRGVSRGVGRSHAGTTSLVPMLSAKLRISRFQFQ